MIILRGIRMDGFYSGICGKARDDLSFTL